MSAMHVTAIGSAAVALIGTLVVALWLPGREPAAQQPVRGEESPAKAGAGR